MKFIANHLVAIHNVATAEAMVLAERAGLDPRTVVDMIAPGAGTSRMFQLRAPMMVERVYQPATMKVSIWKKDMAIIAEFAAAVGCATPMFTLTQPVYTQGNGDGIGRSGHGSRIRGAEEDHHHRTAGPCAGIAASAPDREDGSGRNAGPCRTASKRDGAHGRRLNGEADRFAAALADAMVIT